MLLSYYIMWNDNNGIHSSNPMSYSNAISWLNYLSGEYPEIHHWIEMVQTD
jgi:hypothetical protein